MNLCLEGHYPVHPRLPIPTVGACQQPPYSYVCALQPRPLGASSSLPLPGALPSLARKINSESLELSAKPMRVRGLAEQAESTESERFKEPTDLLLSAREVSPRTDFP